jgi:hypothetical protein
LRNACQFSGEKMPPVVFRRLKKNLSLASLIFAGALSLFSVSNPVKAVTPTPPVSSASSISNSLSKLEERLYEHDYKGEDESQRLARLEKFVFGDVQSGALDQRLANLNEAVVVAPPKVAVPQTSSEEKTYPAFDYGSYPRVNELEQHMLSMTYPKEPLQQRLARLETKAFGKPSTSSDVGARVDALDSYAERHDIFHERRAADSDQDIAPQSPLTVASQAQSDIQNPFTSGEEVTGVEQRVGAMETLVFGHQSGHPLAVRVQKLEKKLVPYDHSLPQKDLASQVDHLWTMLKMANTMNNTPIANQAGGQDAVDNSGKIADASAATPPASHSWLHKLAKSAEGTGANSGAYGDSGMAFPAPGIPYVPGYGMGNGTAVWSPAF